MTTVRVTYITKPIGPAVTSTSRIWAGRLGNGIAIKLHEALNNLNKMFSMWWVLQRAQPRMLALSDRATDGQADLEIAGNDACAGSAQKRPLKFI
jgi:hypothetical protein